MSLHAGMIALVKFPFAEGKGYKWRPGLVVSVDELHRKQKLCWVVMITSAEHAVWASDVAIAAHQSTGLQTACVARPEKIAAVSVEGLQVLGSVPLVTLKKVASQLRKTIA